jgi:ArsR family transcriptional regulator, arsenate/arsenite/antimonite-responsive transcriptional repressor
MCKDDRQYVVMKSLRLIEAECCPQFLAEPLEETEAGRLAGALRVLADPARLHLISLIASLPSGDACVCDLTVPLGLSQPTISYHQKVLVEAGLLTREQRGRCAYFRLQPEPIELLRSAFAAPVGA